MQLSASCQSLIFNQNFEFEKKTKPTNMKPNLQSILTAFLFIFFFGMINLGAQNPHIQVDSSNKQSILKKIYMTM